MSGAHCHQQNCTNSAKSKINRPQLVNPESYLLTNFENETWRNMWTEESKSDTKWQIRNFDLFSEPAADYDFQGKRYLRVDGGSAKSFGVAVLRSPDFLLTNSRFITLFFSF